MPALSHRKRASTMALMLRSAMQHQRAFGG
jgi:hypothetical protein